MANSGATIIEALGLPGAGKSTILNAAIRSLQEQGYQVGTFADLITFGASLTRSQKILALLPTQSVAQFSYAATHSISTLLLGHPNSRIVASLPFHENRLEKYVANFELDYIILDQWTFQAFWSSRIGNPAPASRAGLAFLRYSLAQLPRHFIFFPIDPAQAAKRVTMRKHGRSRFDNESEDMLLKRFRSESLKMVQISEFIKAEGKNIVCLDPLQPIELNSRKVLDYISSVNPRSITTSLEK